MADAKLGPFERGLLALILALSLALRLAGLDAFLTTDEALWNQRSLAFSAALQRGEWPATYQAGHPGVVTMWLGTAAERLPLLQRALGSGMGWLRQVLLDPAPAPGTGVPPLTLGARRLVAVVTWLGVLALVPLLRQLFGARAALLGVALVGLDPFFLAHSRLHHLDGLLTAFVAVSLVSLLVYEFRGRRLRYLLLSAVAAGLAIANKSPAVILCPWAAAVLLMAPLGAWCARPRRMILRGFGALAMWGLLAALTLFAIWPALWVGPLEVLRNVFGVAKHYAETPHEFSNYFWFAVRPDPGPAFYPVVWAFRTTPFVLLGLAALALGRPRHREWGPLALLLLWTVAYAGVMTAGEKKFDRYLLPIFPALDVMAGAGLAAIPTLWSQAADANRPRWVAAGLAAALAAGQFLVTWPTRPYYISYYNPVLGGGSVARRVLLVGWGEGLDRAAAYLNGLPDAETARVISWNFQDFVPFFRGHNVGGAEAVPFAEADYYVFYLNELQPRIPSVVRDELLGRVEPLHTVTLGGVDYAWIYRNTRYDEAAREVLGEIDRQADPARDVILFDVDAACARHYRGPLPVEVLPRGGRDDYVRTGLQRAVGGRERVWHVSFAADPRDTTAAIDRCLTQRGKPGAEIEVGGLRAVRYDLAPGSRFVPAAPAVALNARLGDCIELLGYELSRPTLLPGQPVRVSLYWRATGPVGASYTVFTHLLDPDGNRRAQLDNPPQGGEYPTADWVPGEVIVDDYELQIPLDAPRGTYTLAVGMYNRETMLRLPAFDTAGQALPDGIIPIRGLEVPAGS